MIPNCEEQYTLSFKRTGIPPEQQDSANYVKVTSKKLNGYVSENHFRNLEDHMLKKKLVKNSIGRVAVEVSSFCNRRCNFCPNFNGTRSSEKKYLDEDVYLRVLQDLKSIDFDKTFMFHLYNEPLADPNILDRIRQAKMNVPKARLFIATNGDYLSRSFLESLCDAGVRVIYVSMYDAIKALADRESVGSKIAKMLLELNLSPNRERYFPNRLYEVTASYRDMTIKIASRNLNKTGYDRGGLANIFNRPLRSSPCFAPIVDIDIDWRGNFLPCCNIYSDNALHHKHVAGNLHDGRSIFDHYAEKKMINWRSEVFRFHPKKIPCLRCSRIDFPEFACSENLTKFDEVIQTLNRSDSLK